MILLKNLTKFFGDKKVLDQINVHFSKGKTTAILGPSGSGKTTLLRCLNLLEMPSSGQMIFGNWRHDFAMGESLDTPKVLQLRRQSSMVFQSFNLFPHMTVEQNIIEGPVTVLKCNKVDAIQLAHELLLKVGLYERASDYPHQLSSGQKQRVAIARALAMQPQVLLFDEPTSALDPELEQEVLKVIQSLANEHNTQIIVTHNLDFARSVADEVVFMEAGKIIEKGICAQVFEAPTQARTQEFLKSFGHQRFG